MSPTKRILPESCINGAAIVESSPKRLRGGGNDDGAPPFDNSEELYDDDLMVQEEQLIPEEELAEENKELLETIKTEEQRWKRPTLPVGFNNEEDLNLQWLDMDVTTGKPLDKNPNRKKKNVVGSSNDAVPILRCYGVNEAGNSIAVFIHGFTPYGYFSLPPGYELVDDSSSNFKAIRDILTTRLKGAARGGFAAGAEVMGVTYCTNFKSIMGYQSHHDKFLKIYVSLPGLVPTLKRIMEDGIDLPGVEIVDEALANANHQGSLPVYSAFECNVPFNLRLMVDREISGAGWLTLPKETYQIRDSSKQESHCQVCNQFSFRASPNCTSKLGD